MDDVNVSIRIALDRPASEMAQEEILKQLAHLSKHIRGGNFTETGAELIFEAPAATSAELAKTAEKMVNGVIRGLRSLQRKVVFRSPTLGAERFHHTTLHDGVHPLGPGQVALSGTPLRLFQYFDRVLRSMGERWRPLPLLTPTLIPTHVLARCDYFRSFPHTVTFAGHLIEDSNTIESFRLRHMDRDSLDDHTLLDLDTPVACLSPAVCYHVYHLVEGQTLPAGGTSYSVLGKCFRYEGSNMRDLRRLWDFTMRELVFMGTREEVLHHREVAIELVSQFLLDHQLSGEIRTASDPFFVAPDATSKTYFQLTAETKYEISLSLPDAQRLAVGSLNYHTDFFGRAFNVAVDSGGAMHSVCIAFGLERCVHAFLVQHGLNPSHWPSSVRDSPEFSLEENWDE